MVRPTTTIQVSRRTAERLQSLRSLGLTYDDVINLALDHLPPDDIKRLLQQWLDESFDRLMKHPKVRKGLVSR